MAGLCEGDNERPGSLKAKEYLDSIMLHVSFRPAQLDDDDDDDDDGDGSSDFISTHFLCDVGYCCNVSLA
ncbi:hypothetical protein ANN_15317 [Periplaneta americana]|uniref:Uncharacterized protein n=1 Tax=Periplaneta americana TaxID=6978 RepID=A0ABQ8SG22_PERAM|nr:hypothetical protein ANN_15317 [Periplaneta americana]